MGYIGTSTTTALVQLNELKPLADPLLPVTTRVDRQPTITAAAASHIMSALEYLTPLPKDLHDAILASNANHSENMNYILRMTTALEELKRSVGTQQTEEGARDHFLALASSSDRTPTARNKQWLSAVNKFGKSVDKVRPCSSYLGTVYLADSPTNNSASRLPFSPCSRPRRLLPPLRLHSHRRRFCPHHPQRPSVPPRLLQRSTIRSPYTSLGSAPSTRSTSLRASRAHRPFTPRCSTR